LTVDVVADLKGETINTGIRQAAESKLANLVEKFRFPISGDDQLLY